MEIDRLGRGGTGIGVAPDGAPVTVRGAPPGSRVAVVPIGRRHGVWQARRTALVRPPARRATPPCPAFGTCGGCALQELPLDAQRRAKEAYALAEIAEGFGTDAELLRARVEVRPTTGAPAAYAYRNKIELSFGVRRWLTDAAMAEGVPMAGRFLGFHAPGRFDRVVDLERCDLAGDAMNAVIAVVRAHALAEDAPEPWDPHRHEGFWRHVLLRESAAAGAIAVVLYTAARDDGYDAVDRLAEALIAAPLPGGVRVAGVAHAINHGVADVARGEVRRSWGGLVLDERLGDVVYELSPTSFFQTSTAGARVLYDTVAALLGDGRGLLVDLYCGVGAIGLYLASRFDRVLGIEENAEAVADARRNAAKNGITTAEFHAGRVEDELARLPAGGRGVSIVVDPPRAGLHPRVADALAVSRADTLVYVACNPASLGRDGAILERGGWRLVSLAVVDLFPQTGHVEVVGRFERVHVS